MLDARGWGRSGRRRSLRAAGDSGEAPAPAPTPGAPARLFLWGSQKQQGEGGGPHPPDPAPATFFLDPTSDLPTLSRRQGAGVDVGKS